MDQLNIIEQIMDFDEKLEEWYIPQLPISQHAHKRQTDEEQEHHNKLALGFNDYDDCNLYL